MPFLFKLSHRVARMRTRALLLAAAATLGACEASDPSLSAPTHPSFLTTTGAPAGATDPAAAAMTDSPATPTFTEVDDGTGGRGEDRDPGGRSEEHTPQLQSQANPVCRLP